MPILFKCKVKKLPFYCQLYTFQPKEKSIINFDEKKLKPDGLTLPIYPHQTLMFYFLCTVKYLPLQ